MPVVAAEVLEQRAVEAVEDDEVRLVWHQVGRAAGAAAEHLLEQDAGLDRPQEDDELQVGDVDTGRQQVDGDNDFRVRPVAELADLLQRPINSPSDLADERLTAAEDVAGQLDELIGVRRVRQVVGGEDRASWGSGPSRLHALRRTS